MPFAGQIAEQFEASRVNAVPIATATANAITVAAIKAPLGCAASRTHFIARVADSEDAPGTGLNEPHEMLERTTTPADVIKN